MSDFPKAYVDYLIHFHGTRDYFECHEIMEEHWKADGKESPMRLVWLSLIQAAVALYHERRGNLKGAVKMMAAACTNGKGSNWASLGMNGTEWERRMDERYVQLVEQSDGRGQDPYTDLNIPIIDEKLLEQCKRECQVRSLIWGVPSPMADDEIVHRHLRRDRTEVVETRRRNWEARHAAVRQQDVEGPPVRSRGDDA